MKGIIEDVRARAGLEEDEFSPKDLPPQYKQTVARLVKVFSSKVMGVERNKEKSQTLGGHWVVLFDQTRFKLHGLDIDQISELARLPIERIQLRPDQRAVAVELAWEPGK